IFLPFYRVDESKSGTGIGLTIVKHIVEWNNGSVSFSPAEGGGAAFVVTIPLTQPFVDIPGDVAVAEVPAKLPADYASDFRFEEPTAGDEGTITLLIVEDDADMLDFLVSSFQAKYRVLRASSGEEAFDLLQERNVTLIISDWMMPGISGADLCRRVRENQFLCHIPFILLTAKSDFSSSLESLDCGADAHVKKPFSLVYLQAMVSHLIDIRTMLVHKFSAMPDLTLQPVSSNQGDEAFLARMKELIDANISNVDFSIDMLAEKMCVSRSGLFSKLRSMQGITPNKLIRNARLKSAARILLEGKYPVNVVSYMVGFNNPSYFSKCFFRQYGMGPREWIERHAAQEARSDDSTAL
ncbi:MAG: response regulator, partial [Alistipes sp.]|nr:response regulator [Alistipes sp.]